METFSLMGKSWLRDPLFYARVFSPTKGPLWENPGEVTLNPSPLRWKEPFLFNTGKKFLKGLLGRLETLGSTNC